MLNRENITYGSVCSGIEAATMAWHGLGWEAAWFAEIEAFPSAVLAHHYPSVPNLGDMTKIRDMVASGEVSAPDILVGGTPCQAFSVAGARQSLDDERGQLTLEYVRLANEIDAVRHANGQQPCVIVWENVPGALNTKDNAFGCFLGELSGSGCALQPPRGKWGNAGYIAGPQRQVAWRVLDAQYFGLAQRRKRLFVVTSAREGFNPTEVLFEWEGVRRDTPTSRSSGQDFTANVAPGFAESSFGGFRAGVGTLRAHGGDLGGGSETLTLQPFRKLTFESYAADETASTIMARDYKCATDLVCVHGSCAVRRLTPKETERLQGFPDNYTQIPYRNKSAANCPDGPRYAALGNSMAVPVMAWIGSRIEDAINAKT